MVAGVKKGGGARGGRREQGLLKGMTATAERKKAGGIKNRPEVKLALALNKTGGLKLSVAESCTGGLLSSSITDVPGSSEYFMGSVVAYSNEAKKNVLKVRAGTLNTYGAVSPETAVEMAEGARLRLRADVAVSVTGIAGPGGGTPDKPVGTVYICVTGKDGSLVRGCRLKGTRASIKKQTVERSLDALLDFLKGKRTNKQSGKRA